MGSREKINKYKPPETNEKSVTPEVAEITAETLAKQINDLEQLGKETMVAGWGGIVFPRRKLYWPPKKLVRE